MPLRNYSSKTLRYLRLVTATAVIILLNLSLYLFNRQVNSWLGFLTGILTFLSALANYLIYRILRNRPVTERDFTVKQSYFVFIVISILCICFCCYEIVMMEEKIDRLVMFVLMIILVLIDVLVTIRIKKWMSQK